MPLTALGISFRSVGAVATGTTSLSIAPPSGLLDNDILLMHLTHRGSGFATVPAGWTNIQQGVTATTGIRGEVYWKRASSESGSYSVTGLADSSIGFIEAFPGCILAGDPINTSAISINSSAVFSNKVGPVTTTLPNCMMVVSGHCGTGSYSGDTIRVGNANVEAFFNSEPDIIGTQSIATGANTTGSDSFIIARYQFKAIEGSTINPFYIVGGPNAENVCIAVALKPEVTGSPTSGSRYYLGYGTPGFLGEPWALDGTWADCFIDSRPEYAMFRTLELTQYKAGKGPFAATIGGDLTTPIVVTNQQGNHDILWQRFVTPPLAAQTLSGTLDCCIAFNARWKNTAGTFSADSVCRLKIHAYITVGQTPVVRTVLINDYVNASDLNNANANIVYENLDAAQSVAGSVSAGDSIVIEVGVRVVSSLTPTPTYPPSEWTEIKIIGLGTEPSGATAWAADPVAGGTATNPRTQVAYFDFSDTIVEQALPSSPANISPMTATDMGTLPYVSSRINTKGSSANARALWFKFTATQDGFGLFRAAGTNGSAAVDVYTGDGSAYSTLEVTTGSETTNSQEISGPRSLAVWACPVVNGETYYMRVYCRASAGTTSAASGQSVQIAVSYQEPPLSGDIFLPSNAITAWRNGVCVNWQNSLEDFAPSGCAIDYTLRPMDDENGGTNSNYRLYVASFNTPVVSIYDLTTLNRLEQAVDTIADTLELASGRTTNALGAIHITTGGQLYVQAMGNGFLYVVGIFGGIPAYLNEVSDNADVGYVRGLDATHADNQTGAPWALADEFAASPDETAPWTGGLHPTSGVLYYGSGGVYITLPGAAQIVKTFNVETDTQGANFSTETGSGPVQGVKGMCVASNGDVYITNGDEIIRRSSAGTLLETYTPVSDYPLNMIDVRMDPDGTHIWALDGSTSDLFQFDIASADQTQYVQTWQSAQSALQIAIFGAISPSPDFTIPTETRKIRRLRQSPHISSNGTRMIHNLFQVDMQVGVGLTTGQGSNPLVMFQTSRDGGQTWSQERTTTAGALGKYLTRVMFWRQGMARDMVYRIVVSDPVACRIVSAYLDVEELSS